MIVQVTPALLAFEDLFQRCANEQPGAGLVLLERPAPGIDLTQSAVALRWGAEGDWKPSGPAFAAVIGHEELVIVTHPANPAANISLADLQSIYSGAQRSWPGQEESSGVQPWVYPSGEDVQEIFEAALGGSQPSARVVHLAPDPPAMREAIAANPTAIGFLPRRWVDDSVKILTVDGLDSALLRRPVLAWSKSEPMGPEKAWLICLQEQSSE
jgi:ABC-type phosphate transport system substrate-binding protein